MPTIAEQPGDGRPARGGLDPGALLITTEWEVSGAAARGHTWNLSNEDAPIFLEAELATTDGVMVMEGRCPRCLARPVISRMDRGPLLLILEHEDGCEWLTAFAAKAAQ